VIIFAMHTHTYKKYMATVSSEKSVQIRPCLHVPFHSEVLKLIENTVGKDHIVQSMEKQPKENLDFFQQSLSNKLYTLEILV
jgi:hypothetical protein